MTDFDRAFDLVVGIEGGYSNDPLDPGHETIYGITRRDHPDLWANGRPTIDQAKGRYRERYWDLCRCGELPWPLSLLLFDAAVNQGPGPAVQMLQRALRVVQDGRIGAQTLNAARRSDLADLVPRYLARRALRYMGTANFDHFGEGWLWRLFRLTGEAARIG